jgi:type III secretion system (T3SS) SseB-like protein
MDTAGNQSQAGGDWLRDGPVLADIVIAPAHPAHERTEIVFEVRPGTEGIDVLPVFSSVRHLVAAFGPAQPWLALPLRTVRQLAAAGGVVLDPVVPANAWRWQYSDLKTLDRSLGDEGPGPERNGNP